MTRATFAFTAVATLAATQTFAMSQCGDRSDVIATLADTYAEQHIASGFQSDTGVMEIWASSVDGSWTILMTRPDGQTCVVAAGTHWLTQDPLEMVQGEPA